MATETGAFFAPTSTEVEELTTRLSATLDATRRHGALYVDVHPSGTVRIVLPAAAFQIPEAAMTNPMPLPADAAVGDERDGYARVPAPRESEAPQARARHERGPRRKTARQRAHSAARQQAFAARLATAAAQLDAAARLGLQSGWQS